MSKEESRPGSNSISEFIRHESMLGMSASTALLMMQKFSSITGHLRREINFGMEDDDDVTGDGIIVWSFNITGSQMLCSNRLRRLHEGTAGQIREEEDW